MAETPPEPAETRGGEDPDWAAVRPGEPLPENLKPGDVLRLRAEGVFSEGTLDEPGTGSGDRG